ncbi:MAG TPA: helix-turn-helix transcriptional regulator [Candidatus Acidoferrum sp.]|nr:helix-turn-helix transcriptional regulator [Candidatus Acidoferrum sp.]
MSTPIDPARLDRQLARRGWNATDLARASGISVGTISAARRGRPVSNATLGKIAHALRIATIVEGVDLMLEPEN